MEIIGASDKFKSLIGTKCIQSVRYFKDTIFGLQKCKITKEQSEILKSNQKLVTLQIFKQNFFLLNYHTYFETLSYDLS